MLILLQIVDYTYVKAMSSNKAYLIIKSVVLTDLILITAIHILELVYSQLYPYVSNYSLNFLIRSFHNHDLGLALFAFFIKFAVA